MLSATFVFSIYGLLTVRFCTCVLCVCVFSCMCGFLLLMLRWHHQCRQKQFGETHKRPVSNKEYGTLRFILVQRSFPRRRFPVPTVPTICFALPLSTRSTVFVHSGSPHSPFDKWNTNRRTMMDCIVLLGGNRSWAPLHRHRCCQHLPREAGVETPQRTRLQSHQLFKLQVLASGHLMFVLIWFCTRCPFKQSG